MAVLGVVLVVDAAPWWLGPGLMAAGATATVWLIQMWLGSLR